VVIAVARSSPPRREQKRAHRATAPGARSRFRTRAALVSIAAVALGLASLYAVDRLSGPTHVGRDAALVLASSDSPTLGPATARVHIVEFLDPACGACAHFFPVVERVMDANPEGIRLSIRHVAFHEGSEFAIRVLEASRAQGKYWEMLDALLSMQRLWVLDHKPRPERIRRVASMLDLDREKLERDLQAAVVSKRLIQDRHAAEALKVSATPTFFVNGRAAGRGEAQLMRLISRELHEAYGTSGAPDRPRSSRDGT
jgi:protein-disulfide isomerase